jgi:3-carboxy-cis,cis-muconate cycloisomerase
VFRQTEKLTLALDPDLLMPVSLINSLATTEPLAELFSDSSVLRLMLDFEVALARIESKLEIIPRSAAEAIATAADPARFDIAELSSRSLRAGTPGIPLVKMLRDLVRARDTHAADFVHWGATSQDVSDTALVLLLKRAQPLIEADLVRAEQGLHRLSEEHRSTVMAGRTLLQAAPPVTFGLKAATWFAVLHRGRERLSAAFAEALVLQFGGAVGTLAALGEKGSRVTRELAAELELGCPDAPWHTRRDRLATLVCACGVLTGSLGKIARDVSLLMQTEVGEAAESPSEGRGSSSTMPHKRNPTGCAVTLAAAIRMPGLVSSYLSAMVQEQERAAGGSQSEWSIIAEIVQAMGIAAASVAEIATGLQVDADRMRKNLDATLGTIYSEKAMMLLIPKLGRDQAQQLVEQALQQAISENRQFANVLADAPEVQKALDRTTLQHLSVAEDYLGSAESFRKQQLQTSPAVDEED